MRYPWRSESDAFTFLLLTVVAFAIIAVASLLGGWWVGVPVWILVTLGAVFLYLRGAGEQAVEVVAPAPHVESNPCILVVANEAVAGEPLLDEIRRRSEGAAPHVRVVVPAVNTTIRHWTSDEDRARVAAQARLDQALAGLQAAGIRADGEIGDDDPLQAAEDALRTFGADEIVIATRPEGESDWLAHGVVEAAQDRFGCDVVHVVVPA
jgi:GABA permease